MFEVVERLSLHEQFRLVEIAHETSSTEIRTAALTVLQHYLHPPIMVVHSELEVERA
jgi:hypothetical protein